MHNALAVRCLESRSDLNAEIKNDFQIQPSAHDLLAQGLAFEQFHRDEWLTINFVDLEDRANVGVVESGCGTRLTLKTFECDSIFGQFFRKEFQRQMPAEFYVFSFVNNTHSGIPDFAQDTVMRYGVAEHKRL